MSTENSNEPNSSEQNHRSAIDSLLGNTPPAPAPKPPAAEPPTPPAAPPNDPPTPEAPAAPASEDNNTPKADPSINIFEKLAEISNGTIKTEDDFKGIVQRASEYGDLESRFNTLTAEHETVKNTSPFANPYLEKLNDLYKSDAPPEKIDLFIRINQLGDLKALSSQDAVKWELREKYGLTEQQADIKLRNAYKTDETQFTEEEVQNANIDLKIAGDKAKEYLQGLQASFEVKSPEPVVTETPEQIQAKAAQYEAVLNPVVKSIEQELPSYFSKINVNGLTDDKALTVDLPVPAEVQTHIADQVKQFATSHQLDLSKPEAKKEMQDFAKNLTKIAMFDAWVIDISNKRDELVRQEFSNPSSIQHSKDNPAAPAKTSTQEAASRVANTF